MVLLDLLIQSLLDFLLDHGLFHLLVSFSFVLFVHFLQGSLINEPVLHLKLFHSSLPFELIVVLVYALVLPIVFVFVVAVHFVDVLVLKVFLQSLELLLPGFHFLQLFDPELFV